MPRGHGPDPADSDDVSTPAGAAMSGRAVARGPSGDDPLDQDAATDADAGSRADAEHAADAEDRRDAGHAADAEDRGDAGDGELDGDTGEGPGRQRRRRRLVVAGISVGAALVVAALCAGSLAVISTIDGFRDSSMEVRATRQQRDTACLDLEGRLNRVAPPGSTANPAGRAVAIRNENTALRLYLSDLEQQRGEGDNERGEDRRGDGGRGEGDNWRALLDARTSYAEALDRSAQTRTPAFFVSPRAGDGPGVRDQLARRSPVACAGAIRRLAAPDL